MDKKYIEKLSGTRDPIFNEAVLKVLDDTARTPDENCIDSSREGEEDYIVTHLQSCRHNTDCLRMALDLLSCDNFSDTSVLDIGTSPLTFIYKLCLDVKFSTIDLTSLLGKRCVKFGVVHKQCDLLKDSIPFEAESFNICVFTEVMEHLPLGYDHVFNEINRILKPDGLLVFSVPNFARVKNRLLTFVGRPVLDPIYKVFHGGPHGFGHVRTYTMYEVKNLLGHYGFEVLRGASVDPVRYYHRRVNPCLKIAFVAREAIVFMLPNSRTINAVLCRKQPSKSREIQA